jgi:hypothetical protein
MQRTDQPLPIKVRIWLSHKVILSHKTRHYKNPEVAASLDKCRVIAKMVRSNCIGYNKGAICRMLLAHEQHLRNILPDVSNSSYKSSLDKLENILNDALTYINQQTA